MKQTQNRSILIGAALFVAVGIANGAPEVANVVMMQREGSRIVEITYELNTEAAIVTLGIESNGSALPDSAVTRLSGDVCRLVEPGTNKSILWNAGADWPENLTQVAKAKVTAWSTNAPPQVMVIDFTGGAATNIYPLTYYPSLDALPYGGITNTIYKSTYLAMQKIPAGNFPMGEGSAAVLTTLSQDFYIGVFPVTQGQWYKVMGDAFPSYFIDTMSRAFRPMEYVSYDDIRGTAEQGGGGWPTNSGVYADSFVGRLRTRTGDIEGFDLPTDAQWEYACRADTTTYYSDGLAKPASTTSNAQMDVLGRYQYNGGDATLSVSTCGPENGTAIVGSYRPNPWGLYDMHGNVWEWCLDWMDYGAPLPGGVDPKGAASSNVRVRRGGTWSLDASYCRSAFRSRVSPNSRTKDIGFRLVRTLP